MFKVQRTKRISTIGHEPPIRSHVVDRPSTSVSNSQSIVIPQLAEPLYQLSHVDDAHDPTPDDDRAYYTPYGQFAGDVTAAVDDRGGLAPSPIITNLVPFVDAPLFGEIDWSPPGSGTGSATKLPPRAYADRLVGVYWQHVHPIESVLDKEQFLHDYEDVYNSCGASVDEDRTIRLSIINLVFALAVQRQELIPLQQRDEEANGYFLRAWALLPLEKVLWEPGSLELVQCLMLMNRYLHCTNNRQKTWTTAGLAIRIAQSLRCYLAYDSSSKESSKDRKLKQQIWASCVGLDRCVSWSLGTISTSFPVLPWQKTEAPNSTPLNGSQQDMSHVEQLYLEIYEIGNQIQLAQTQTRNTFGAKLGLPRPYQQEQYHSVAVQLDACIDRWEDKFPTYWKLQNLPQVVDSVSRTHGYLLQIRLLLQRLFLFRPLLARVYSIKPDIVRDHTTSNSSSLGDRIIKDCAKVCVEAAQKLTKLIIEILEPYEPMGLLPWWYRIYYLHIAGTHFLAAMFSTEIFTESVSRSWDDVMSALRAHEHLSTYVPQCIQKFEALSARISQTRQLNTEVNGDFALDFQGGDLLNNDIFQDLGWNFDDFLYGSGVMMDG
ncbi:hypothetical protein TCE0_043f15536 [Talaromyces pinophilus]|uniref:Xylanolytic transcriptional activator regulatory domain-containing protein n=1 Tax=Talaromyces pinophilus TaxID=128442 RepID=A0A0B8MY59_TALPI|nr:hypothetical protein TCE0_043f15536 [Talaromyces pinophilus]